MYGRGGEGLGYRGRRAIGMREGGGGEEGCGMDWGGWGGGEGGSKDLARKNHHKFAMKRGVGDR